MDFGACDLVEEAAQVERREPGRILIFAHGGDMAALLQMAIICRRRPQRLDLALDRLAALTSFVGLNIDARSGLQGNVMIKQIDRQIVLSGKSGSVRVDLSGRRIL